MAWFPLDLGETIPGTTHFRWKEFLWLPQWKEHIFPREDVRDNIQKTARKLQDVRNIIGCPLRITSGYRPAAYNKQIGGAPNSYHTKGLAVDFRPAPIDGELIPCDLVRAILKDNLHDLGIRMERLPSGSPWVHIDLGEPGPTGRYFRP